MLLMLQRRNSLAIAAYDHGMTMIHYIAFAAVPALVCGYFVAIHWATRTDGHAARRR